MFVTDQPFGSNQILASEAGGLLKQAKLERLPRDKRTSLFGPFVNYGEKSFVKFYPTNQPFIERTNWREKV